MNKLVQHDKRFDAHDKKFKEHDKRFDGIERRLDGHDKRLDEYSRHFTNIECQLDKHGKTLDEYRIRFDRLENQNDFLAIKSLDHEKRLERIEATMATKTDITELRTWTQNGFDEIKEIMADNKNEIMNTLDHVVVVVERNSDDIKSLAHNQVRMQDTLDIHTKEIVRIKAHVGLS